MTVGEYFLCEYTIKTNTSDNKKATILRQLVILIWQYGGIREASSRICTLSGFRVCCIQPLCHVSLE